MRIKLYKLSLGVSYFLLGRIPFLKKRFLRARMRNQTLFPEGQSDFQNAEIVKTDMDTRHLNVGLVRPPTEIHVDGDMIYGKARAWHLKFERFLKNNDIRYEYYEVSTHHWMEQVAKFNVVLWKSGSSPHALSEILQKIYVLEQMGIKCFPSFDDIRLYENKVASHFFYRQHNLPEIPTFVSFSKPDAIAYAKQAKYPLISKLATGSSSLGVEKISDEKSAIRLINQVFSYWGRETYWPYERQKNYILFQEFIDDATFDLRVIVIGDKLFGYYRMPKRGDYRASGAGIYEKKEIPAEALDIAWTTKQARETSCLAVDLLYSAKRSSYYIIESSIFFGVDTCEQLKINDIAGYYQKENDRYFFVPGRYWIQELALKDFIEKHCQYDR